MPDRTVLPASLAALLDGLVDYAGLFPPAALPLDDAAARFAEYRAGPDRHALGRFVAPAASLDALADLARRHGASARDPWPVSALVADGTDDLAHVARHGAGNGRGIVVDAIETRAAPDDDPSAGSGRAVAHVAGRLPPGVTGYVELPHGSDPVPLVRALAAAGLRAKIRTGGLTPDAFPDAHELVRFILACRDAGVAFKATAGLHHPLRGEYPLTYAADSVCGAMYGFVNVFVAALLLREGADPSTAERVLMETDRAAFAFDEAGLLWREHRIAIDRVRDGRRHFATSFGSCSFEEPVGEVRGLL